VTITATSATTPAPAKATLLVSSAALARTNTKPMMEKPTEGTKWSVSTLAMAASPVSYSLSAAEEMSNALTGSPPAWPNGVTLFENIAAVNTNTAIGAEIGEPMVRNTIHSAIPQEATQTAVIATINTSTDRFAPVSADSTSSIPMNQMTTLNTSSAAVNITSVVSRSPFIFCPTGPAA